VQLQPITPDPKRDADAAVLAEQAITWPVVTLKRAFGAFPVGSIFYGVPSRSKPGARYLANALACQCPDYQRRGAMCAHVRAVRLFEQTRQQAEGSADQADPTTDLGLATDDEINAHMASSAATFRQDEARRRRLITSSPFFQDAPVAVRVRPLRTYAELYPVED
jgi:hypothetical protein